jgi:hypothetical protein
VKPRAPAPPLPSRLEPFTLVPSINSSMPMPSGAGMPSLN